MARAGRLPERRYRHRRPPAACRWRRPPSRSSPGQGDSRRGSPLRRSGPGGCVAPESNFSGREGGGPSALLAPCRRGGWSLPAPPLPPLRLLHAAAAASPLRARRPAGFLRGFRAPHPGGRRRCPSRAGQVAAAAAAPEGNDFFRCRLRLPRAAVSPPRPAPPPSGPPLHPPGPESPGHAAWSRPRVGAPRSCRRVGGGQGLICGRSFPSPGASHGMQGRTVLPWFLIQRVVMERQVRGIVSGGGKPSPLPLLYPLLPRPKQLTTFQPRTVALPDHVFSCSVDSHSPDYIISSSITSSKMLGHCLLILPISE